MSGHQEEKLLPALLSPLDLKGLALKNRVVLAPLTRGRAGEERVPNTLMAEYYRQRGGAGLMISEATSISETANCWEQAPGIYTDSMVEGWKLVTDAVHQAGSKIFLQLWHGGRASHSHFLGGELPVAPSAIAIQGDGVHTLKGKLPHETPRALETEEVATVVGEYQRAASNAMKAGFDGVEIHAANGYLIDQFLQSKSNQRTDQYGGSVENQHRFLQEIVQAISEVMPENRIGVRLSPNGIFGDMGSPEFREQFSYSMKELDKFDLAFLHIVDGLGFGFHELGQPVTLADCRQWYRGLLIGNCGYDRDSADSRIAEGNADMISFGRDYISNPDLAERFAVGAELNVEADPSVWYQLTGEKNYTDYPTMELSS